MAVLTTQQRAELHAAIMRALSDIREACPMLKADLLAAINAADDWANSNAASYNTALPLPFRTVATADQKSRLLEMVIIARRKVGA